MIINHNKSSAVKYFYLPTNHVLSKHPNHWTMCFFLLGPWWLLAKDIHQKADLIDDQSSIHNQSVITVLMHLAKGRLHNPQLWTGGRPFRPPIPISCRKWLLWFMLGCETLFKFGVKERAGEALKCGFTTEVFEITKTWCQILCTMRLQCVSKILTPCRMLKKTDKIDS